ncbi:hypothetical protein FACS1894159_09940 [Bacteroidia bacterium]|nr:hypothetical protein FACS1894159_09940 [Bacteroidia bacterium]
MGVAAGLMLWFAPALGGFVRRHLIVVSVSALTIAVIAGVALFGYKPGSANARLLVWRVGIEMVARRPATGYGVASFHRVYMPRQGDYFEAHPDSPWRMVADNAVYPYNEPLHVLMDQGLVGLILVAAIFASTLLYRPPKEGRCSAVDSGNTKGRASTVDTTDRSSIANEHNRTAAAPAAGRPDDNDQRAGKAALTASILFSCFSYPSYVFALFFLFPVLLGSLDSKPVGRFALPGWLSTTLKAALAAGVIYGARQIGHFKEGERQVGRLFSGDPKAINYVTAYYDRLRYNPVFNNIYAVWLGSRPEAADRMPPKHIDGMDPSCENYCTAGNYYSRRGMCAEAERCYLRAGTMIPTRLMPNYLLWQLYADCGDTLRAAATARTALHQPLKVENDFTRTAKMQMKEFLENNE